nr:hypothetical protein L204_05076 [Cryptococcus depauperatus CBS 7855]
MPDPNRPSDSQNSQQSGWDKYSLDKSSSLASLPTITGGNSEDYGARYLPLPGTQPTAQSQRSDNQTAFTGSHQPGNWTSQPPAQSDTAASSSTAGQRTVPVETTNAGMSRYNDAVQGQRVQNEETVARSQADSQVPSYIRGDGRDYGATEYLETGTIVYYPVQRRR